MSSAEAQLQCQRATVITILMTIFSSSSVFQTEQMQNESKTFTKNGRILRKKGTKEP